MFLKKIFGLKGKVSAIIGGYGTLGSKMSEGLAKAGSDIVILGPTRASGEKMAAKISKLGVEALYIKTDATIKDELITADKIIHERFGKIDILINAPGINSSTPFLEIKEEEWQKILDVNLKSIFLSCQVFGKRMIDNKRGGSIINISSASSGPPLSKVFTYSVSKAGINNLTQNLAREWAKYDIRVNALIPGFFPAKQNREVLTKERIESIIDHTPMNRFGEPEELIGVVILLASEEASSFITGALIRVDGGFLSMTI
ncbi:MAG: SDR family oxidoreductase [Candidatus Lokiarchaeota archaeon]|nr:SDR family oxidoreductase [Candidatus Lokiarchaeota archaeon]